MDTSKMTKDVTSVNVFRNQLYMKGSAQPSHQMLLESALKCALVMETVVPKRNAALMAVDMSVWLLLFQLRKKVPAQLPPVLVSACKSAQQMLTVMESRNAVAMDAVIFVLSQWRRYMKEPVHWVS